VKDALEKLWTENRIQFWELFWIVVATTSLVLSCVVIDVSDRIRRRRWRRR
jgi:hypothetical protein